MVTGLHCCACAPCTLMLTLFYFDPAQLSSRRVTSPRPDRSCRSCEVSSRSADPDSFCLAYNVPASPERILLHTREENSVDATFPGVTSPTNALPPRPSLGFLPLRANAQSLLELSRGTKKSNVSFALLILHPLDLSLAPNKSRLPLQHLNDVRSSRTSPQRSRSSRCPLS